MKESSIFCVVRRMHVACTPEECVRQNFLNYLFQIGGYPKHLTRVEMPLSFFSICGKVDKRRLDVICFQKKEETLVPLLLVECKAYAPQSSVISQLFGYNFFVKAPFAAIVWQDSLALYHQNTLDYFGIISQMPAYKELCNHSEEIF